MNWYAINHYDIIAVNDELRDGVLVSLDYIGSPVGIQAHMLFHREKWLAAPIKALEEVVYEYGTNDRGE